MNLYLFIEVLMHYNVFQHVYRPMGINLKGQAGFPDWKHSFTVHVYLTTWSISQAGPSQPREEEENDHSGYNSGDEYEPFGWNLTADQWEEVGQNVLMFYWLVLPDGYNHALLVISVNCDVMYCNLSL